MGFEANDINDDIDVFPLLVVHLTFILICRRLPLSKLLLFLFCPHRPDDLSGLFIRISQDFSIIRRDVGWPQTKGEGNFLLE
jgi:hypothetical protein